MRLEVSGARPVFDKERRTMKRTATKLLAIVFLLGAGTVVLNACNTVAGVGEDVQAVGKGVTKGAEKTKSKM
jgi:predicted small secreted protein